MNSMVKKVFALIFVMVLIFLLWQLAFSGKNSLIARAYNGIANSVNEVWARSNGYNYDDEGNLIGIMPLMFQNTTGHTESLSSWKIKTV